MNELSRDNLSVNSFSGSLFGSVVRPAEGDQGWIPSSRLTSTNAVTARSRSSRVWAALIWGESALFPVARPDS